MLLNEEQDSVCGVDQNKLQRAKMFAGNEATPKLLYATLGLTDAVASHLQALDSLKEKKQTNKNCKMIVLIHSWNLLLIRKSVILPNMPLINSYVICENSHYELFKSFDPSLVISLCLNLPSCCLTCV